MDTTAIKETLLITPYGGALKNLVILPEETEDFKAYANTLPSLQLSARAICDLELLATGAFSPLDCFMTSADYRSVLEKMRLASGHVFPIPITLPIDAESKIREGQEIALRDAKNNLLATMSVEELYEWSRAELAQKVLGTGDAKHPLVAEMNNWGKFNISGRLRVVELPRYYDFPDLRLSLGEVRARLEKLGNKTIIAFQTRNPLHRAHEGLIQDAMEKTGGALLLHPVVGLTKPGDVDYYSRVRTYKILTEKYYDRSRVVLALLPLAMRFAGPREALWHALIRRNFGANHLIVGRDHAGPGADSNGKSFYEPYAAQELVEKFSEELGVKVVPFRQFVYVPETAEYMEAGEEMTGQKRYFELSGTEVRDEYLGKGERLPAWFTRPEVADILEETYAPRHRQGVCLWFTGLSGAGKSTVAEILTAMLSMHGRRVTLLDGDIVRTNLSAGLGFDKKGRDANIRRIGFVASEITRHNGIAVCAAISPYEKTRAEIRRLVGENFIEIYVDTPLEVCEERDTKGMYAKARRGEIKDFTGIDDVYEPPANAEITLATVNQTPAENARSIINYLIEKGFIKSEK
ncbi:MAG TPA: bifunctional sulfate adenylyltransferase/adenylylsulfate kinase [Pyrinomonadaceae bacterium]